MRLTQLAISFPQFPFADLLLAYDLEKRWHRLFKSALQRNQSLQVVKSKFAEMTSKEVTTFNAKVRVRVKQLTPPPHFRFLTRPSLTLIEMAFPHPLPLCALELHLADQKFAFLPPPLQPPPPTFS